MEILKDIGSLQTLLQEIKVKRINVETQELFENAENVLENLDNLIMKENYD